MQVKLWFDFDEYYFEDEWSLTKLFVVQKQRIDRLCHIWETIIFNTSDLLFIHVKASSLYPHNFHFQ